MIYYKTLSYTAIEYTAIPPEGYQNHVKPEACRGFYMILIPRGWNGCIFNGSL